MTEHHDERAPSWEPVTHVGHQGQPLATTAPTSHQGHSGHGHRWMMIACCVPMVLVVVGLLISGVAGPGALVFAGVCLGMMWLMMKAMPDD